MSAFYIKKGNENTYFTEFWISCHFKYSYLCFSSFIYSCVYWLKLEYAHSDTKCWLWCPYLDIYQDYRLFGWYYNTCHFGSCFITRISLRGHLEATNPRVDICQGSCNKSGHWTYAPYSQAFLDVSSTAAVNLCICYLSLDVDFTSQFLSFPPANFALLAIRHPTWLNASKS